MQTDLCVGIAARHDVLEIAALSPDGSMTQTSFPASRLGLTALKLFLAAYGPSARLAVSGVAAPSLALALENESGSATFIVSSSIAPQAKALARYAEHTA
ncbi:hypothetical protein HCX48_12500 [Rhodocyclus tenuis]|uniref:Uncharacterized protein n=2 Tax=Rhodocyclus TaxID=1064 RepID=A0A6L5JUU0_RHOTE|nr:hypothetical protein [Rhodocyclus gracilis]MQY50856.1 hypothetical protein [Rhodocyclus gracilis]NJA90035.1 hypothetical protein [Rhodocyclus gracilis]